MEAGNAKKRQRSKRHPAHLYGVLFKFLLILDIQPSALVLQPGLITQANGSAYIETEKTKVACAVYFFLPFSKYQVIHWL